MMRSVSYMEESRFGMAFEKSRNLSEKRRSAESGKIESYYKHRFDL